LGYDTVDCREAVDLGGRALIPASKNAKEQKQERIPALKGKDEAIRRIQELGDEGRSLWKGTWRALCNKA